MEKLLGEIITNKATIKDDIPAIILKTFARNVSIPTTILVNRCIKEGAWPNIFKSEIVTPVPKVYPTKRIGDLRNITGLFTLNKVMEKSIAELMVNDMKEKLDPSQYANHKGIGIQHYLINMLDRILTAVDNGSNIGRLEASLPTSMPQVRCIHCHGNQTISNTSVNKLLSES